MRWISAVALVLLVAVLPVRAHVVIPTDFREVVSEANLIVRGRVTDIRSVVVPDAGIDTIATVAVETVLKGRASGFVYVRVPGGRAGGSRIVMVGAPTFHTGDRAVLFLKPSGSDSSYRPIGLTLGVFRVLPDPKTRRPVVEPPLVTGFTASGTGPAVRGDTRRKLMPIADFESLVRLVTATRAGQAVGRPGGK